MANPTARDVETARALSPCIRRINIYPMDSFYCRNVEYAQRSDQLCQMCERAERIARALATARAEEREVIARFVDETEADLVTRLGGITASSLTVRDIAAAIRAQGGGA